MKRFSLGLLALATALAIAPAAKADTLYFNFGGPGVFGGGSLTVTSLGGGLFDITGGTITIQGHTSSIVANPNSNGAAAVSPDGAWFYDDVVNLNGGPALDTNGLLFKLSNNWEVEIWYANGTYMWDAYDPYTGQWTINGANGAPITFDVSDSPEPSTLMLLGTGLLFLAVGLYRKARTRAPKLVLAN